MGARLQARAEALATPRNAAIVLAAAVAVALLAYLLRPTYPNYDSYYTLLWGDQLARGQLPDYDVFRPPTPHLLATALAALLSPLDGISDRLLVLISLGSLIALFAILFRFTQLLLGTLVAIAATAFLVTRTDVELLALRGTVDVPFLALVFGAALMELKRPRRGAPVLVLLGLAGLLRPEAWVFAGVYFLWMWPAMGGWRERLGYAALAAAAPVLWVAFDLVVTGEPLYSLTQTREVAGQVARDRGVGDAITLLPDFIGGNEKVVNVVAGGLGLLLAVYILRARAALPLAIGGIGVAVFMMIAAAGLSVIPRYLLIPSLLLNLCVGVALAGWTLVPGGRARRVAIGLAALTALAVAWRADDYLADARRLSDQANFVKEQHQTFKAVLSGPALATWLAREDCRPITVPTHSAIPVLRLETGIPKERIRASIEQRRPPTRGILLVARTFNFEPTAARSVVAAGGGRSARKYWSNVALPTFAPVAGNYRWRAVVNC